MQKGGVNTHSIDERPLQFLKLFLDLIQSAYVFPFSIFSQFYGFECFDNEVYSSDAETESASTSHRESFIISSVIANDQFILNTLLWPF